MTVRRGGTALLVLLLALPASVRAQEQQSGQQQGQEQGEEGAEELVFEREVFTYPGIERRNPFRPLVGQDEGGPRFEDLTLLGIIHSSDPEESLVLFAGQPGESDRRTAYRVRRGERIGNTTVLEIQPERVIVEVEEFGVTEQHVLQLVKPGEGAPS